MTQLRNDTQLAHPVHRERLALLVDGDNIAWQHAAALLEIARGLGDIGIRRVYVDRAHLAQWLEVPGLRLVHAGQGRNASDMALVVDAMGFALDGAVSHVVIASNDRDYSYLAWTLRERGLRVTGIGGVTASPRWRRACTGFVELSPVETAIPPALPPAAAPAPATASAPAAGTARIDAAIRRVLERHGGAGRTLGLSRLANYLIDEEKISRESCGTSWSVWFRRRPELFDLRGEGAGLTVGLRRG